MFVTVLSDKPELREKFCNMLGAQISKGEMSFYSLEQENKKIILIEPSLYPEKIQPLLYALSMADYVVLLADGITPKLGELIVSINCMKIDKGIIVSASALPLAGTTLDKFEKVLDLESAKAKVLALSSPEYGENSLAFIDHMESVKSIGNVASGILKAGSIKAEDKFYVLPERKELEIRSLQVNGKDVAQVFAGERFSAAYTGDAFERGILVPLRNEFETETIVNGRFLKTPFFKDELKGKIHAYVNMQFVEGHINENDLTLSQPLSYEKGEIILVIDASNQKLRVAGPFQSKW